jgi:hypothetical protein
MHMSIEAMKQVIELYDKHCYNNDYGGIEFNKKHGYKFIEAIEALRTAIQQAEAQQPATGEPVGFVDFQGTVFWHDGPPPADSLLFAAKPVSHDKAKWCEYVAGMVFTWLEMQENLKEEDRCIKAIAGIIERRMWALLTTHPAPSVPADVVRDAERYRFIRDADVSDDLIPDIALYAMESLDEYIDAAMLAAK